MARSSPPRTLLRGACEGTISALFLAGATQHGCNPWRQQRQAGEQKPGRRGPGMGPGTLAAAGTGKQRQAAGWPGTGTGRPRWAPLSLTCVPSRDGRLGRDPSDPWCPVGRRLVLGAVRCPLSCLCLCVFVCCMFLYAILWSREPQSSCKVGSPLC